jgi:hypothetical protein
MIKNKIILIPTITIIIILSVFISFAYGLMININEKNNNYFCNKNCLIIFGLTIISIVVIFNIIILLQRNNKPLNLIV